MSEITNKSITTKLAQQYGVDPAKFYECLKAIIFKRDTVTNEEVMAFLIVCDRYDLNPFMREIYAIQSKDGNLLPTVSVDAWYNLVHRQKTLDGLEFVFSDKMSTVELEKSVKHYDGSYRKQTVKITAPEYCDAIIYVKGMSHPYRVREYFEEVVRATDNWERYPRRMLRHKSLIQCARAAFSFGGVIDSDDAEAIAAEGVIEAMHSGPTTVVDVPANAIPEATKVTLANEPTKPIVPTLQKKVEELAPVQAQKAQEVPSASAGVEKRNLATPEKREQFVKVMRDRLVQSGLDMEGIIDWFRKKLHEEDFEWAKNYLSQNPISTQAQA